MAKGAAAAVEEEVAEDEALFENAEDGLVINLEGVEAQRFEPLPRGVYDAMIEDAEFATSKTSGKPMWTIKLAVLTEGYENRKLFTFLSWSPKAVGGSKAALLTFAPELGEAKFRADDKEILAGFQGRRVRVKVTTEEYQGQDQNRIKQWLIPNEAEADGFGAS